MAWSALRGVSDVTQSRQPSACPTSREEIGWLAGNRSTKIAIEKSNSAFVLTPMAKRHSQNRSLLSHGGRRALHSPGDRFDGSLVLRMLLQVTMILCTPRTPLCSFGHLVPLLKTAARHASEFGGPLRTGPLLALARSANWARQIRMHPDRTKDVKGPHGPVQSLPARTHHHRQSR